MYFSTRVKKVTKNTAFLTFFYFWGHKLTNWILVLDLQTLAFLGNVLFR